MLGKARLFQVCLLRSKTSIESEGKQTYSYHVIRAFDLIFKVSRGRFQSAFGQTKAKKVFSTVVLVFVTLVFVTLPTTLIPSDYPLARTRDKPSLAK